MGSVVANDTAWWAEFVVNEVSHSHTAQVWCFGRSYHYRRFRNQVVVFTRGKLHLRTYKGPGGILSVWGKLLVWVMV